MDSCGPTVGPRVQYHFHDADLPSVALETEGLRRNLKPETHSGEQNSLSLLGLSWCELG